MPEARQPEPGQVTAGQKATAAAIIIAGMVAIASPLAEKWEGYRGKAYLDPAKILTQCYGETEDIDPARIYSQDECAVKLRKRMATDYAPLILKCLPELMDERRVAVGGALLDASYNAGPVAVCKSSMARNIRAGNWQAACDALPYWYVTAQKRVNGKRVGKPFLLKGLVARRKDERLTCLKGV